MEYHDYWVTKTLLIEAHNIIHGFAASTVCGLCEPEDRIRISYPPLNYTEIDIASLAEKMTDNEIHAVLSGELSWREIQAIKSMNVGMDSIKKQVLNKIFIEGFSALIFHLLNLFDGTADPHMVNIANRCASWRGAIISPLSPEEERLVLPPEDLGGYIKSVPNGYKSLENRFYDTYQYFQDLISTEPHVLPKVESFEDDETVLEILMLEAYYEIEIQSRQFIKTLQNPGAISLVYPLDETNEFLLKETEQQAIHSLGIGDEFLQTTLQKVLADGCYNVISSWLKAFEWTYTPLSIPKSRVWRGAKISTSGCRYPDMLHDAFYEAWHEFNKINSELQQRPF